MRRDALGVWAQQMQTVTQGMGKQLGATVTAQGTIFHKLWKTIMEKNMKENGYV